MINKETYKRLTRRNEKGFPTYNCSDEDIKDCELYYNCGECYKSTQVIKRLAELEDKIMDGTLIDTKVKIGQRVFRRGFFKGEIDEYIVSNIILENGKLEVHLKHDFDEHKTCYSATVLGIEEIGKTVFLTKAEAEAKLKELQENKK